MGRSETDRTAGEPERPFEIGCGQIALGILVVVVLLGIRLGQLDREKAAVEAIRKLGGTVIYGNETYTTEWLQPLMPARVVVVKLGDTRATNDDLRCLRALGHLEWLHLDHTLIAGGGLEPLAGLTKLRVLSLEGTGIGDDDLRHLAGLKKLTVLRLAGTQVTDAGLSCLGPLVGLDYLSIGNTKITGDGLAELRTFEGLRQLGIDETQVSPASVAHLQTVTSLERVLVHVTHGTGKRARDLLARLTRVEALGFRRVRQAGTSPFLPPCEGRLWDRTTPWEAATGGIVETILAKVPLKPEESERLLDVLVLARPGGDWRPSSPPSSGRPQRAAAKGPVRDRIKNDAEFFQALRTGSDGDFARALAYARSGAARASVPVLLRLLKAQDPRLRHRAATILIRLGLGDKQVAAGIRGMLKARDVHERARIVRAFDVSRWRGGYGDIVPRIGPADAKVAAALLVEVSRDESWEVRKGVTEGLACVFQEHPQDAERVVPIVLNALNDSDCRVRMTAPSALGSIAKASPQQGKAMAHVLLTMLKQRRGEAKKEVTMALDGVGRQCAQAAAVAVPALLELLQDKDSRIKTLAFDALANVAPSLLEAGLRNRAATAK